MPTRYYCHFGTCQYFTTRKTDLRDHIRQAHTPSVSSYALPATVGPTSATVNNTATEEQGLAEEGFDLGDTFEGDSDAGAEAAAASGGNGSARDGSRGAGEEEETMEEEVMDEEVMDEERHEEIVRDDESVDPEEGEEEFNGNGLEGLQNAHSMASTSSAVGTGASVGIANSGSAGACQMSDLSTVASNVGDASSSAQSHAPRELGYEAALYWLSFFEAKRSNPYGFSIVNQVSKGLSFSDCSLAFPSSNSGLASNGNSGSNSGATAATAEAPKRRSRLPVSMEAAFQTQQRVQIRNNGDKDKVQQEYRRFMRDIDHPSAKKISYSTSFTLKGLSYDLEGYYSISTDIVKVLSLLYHDPTLRHLYPIVNSNDADENDVRGVSRYTDGSAFIQASKATKAELGEGACTIAIGIYSDSLSVSVGGRHSVHGVYLCILNFDARLETSYPELFWRKVAFLGNFTVAYRGRTVENKKSVHAYGGRMHFNRVYRDIIEQIMNVNKAGFYVNSTIPNLGDVSNTSSRSPAVFVIGLLEGDSPEQARMGGYLMRHCGLCRNPSQTSEFVPPIVRSAADIESTHDSETDTVLIGVSERDLRKHGIAPISSPFHKYFLNEGFRQYFAADPYLMLLPDALHTSHAFVSMLATTDHWNDPRVQYFLGRCRCRMEGYVSNQRRCMLLMPLILFTMRKEVVLHSSSSSASTSGASSAGDPSVEHGWDPYSLLVINSSISPQGRTAAVQKMKSLDTGGRRSTRDKFFDYCCVYSEILLLAHRNNLTEQDQIQLPQKLEKFVDEAALEQELGLKIVGGKLHQTIFHMFSQIKRFGPPVIADTSGPEACHMGSRNMVINASNGKQGEEEATVITRSQLNAPCIYFETLSAFPSLLYSDPPAEACTRNSWVSINIKQCILKSPDVVIFDNLNEILVALESTTLLKSNLGSSRFVAVQQRLETVFERDVLPMDHTRHLLISGSGNCFTSFPPFLFSRCHKLRSITLVRSKSICCFVRSAEESEGGDVFGLPLFFVFVDPCADTSGTLQCRKWYALLWRFEKSNAGGSTDTRVPPTLATMVKPMASSHALSFVDMRTIAPIRSVCFSPRPDVPKDFSDFFDSDATTVWAFSKAVSSHFTEYPLE